MSPARKISVLLPVYNAGVPLTQAIESILRQTHRELELVVIDDRSTDGSAAIIRDFAGRDPRVRGIFHQKNLGLSSTLNEGLQLATSELVARMDQDDESLPERLAVQLDFLERNPGVVVAGSWVYNMGREPKLDRLMRVPYTPPEIKTRLAVENCLYHPSVMLRRQAILELGGYRAEFKNAEDYDLWLRLSGRHALANIPRPLLRYRLSTTGMTMSRKWEQLGYVLLAQESHKHPAQPPAALWPAVEARLARINRQEYFDHVTLDSVRRLQRLGFAEDAARVEQALAGELSPGGLARLRATRAAGGGAAG